MNEFRVTTDHIKLLKASYVSWDDCEYGAPAIDCKRPYGNSMVAADICHILGWEVPTDEDEDWPEEIYLKARAIHEEMKTVLQILLANAEQGIKPGLYRTPEPYRVREWEWVSE